MIKIVLLVNEIWEFVDKEIQKTMNHKELEVYEELDVKAKLIILYGVKYHFIPHLTKKNTSREIWKVVQDLLHNKNENRLLVLREKLKKTKMLDGECLAPYLKRIY